MPTYAHSTPAGSELSLHSVLSWLAGRGHEIAVVLPGAHESTELDGVAISGWNSSRELRRRYRDADVVLTQLERRNAAIRMAARTDRPLVHFLRMGAADPSALFGRPALVVFNASWVRERHPWPGPNTVLHSPVFADQYRVKTDRSCVTLIGLSELKGAHTFFALAERRPDLQFLALRGAWGDQLIPERLPANVEILPTTPGISDVYARTRVLLMPSRNETRGRTALEAAASGIPTIAHPTPGLVETLGPAGLFADRADTDAWVRILAELDGAAHYEEQRQEAFATSARWDPVPELNGFERRLRSLPDV